jgi:hypothetical protein
MGEGWGEGEITRIYTHSPNSSPQGREEFGVIGQALWGDLFTCFKHPYWILSSNLRKNWFLSKLKNDIEVLGVLPIHLDP